MGRDEEGLEFPGVRARFAAHDFWVDFLGGLVPGTLFLLGLFGALGPPLYTVIDAFNPARKMALGEVLKATVTATRDTPNFLWIALFLVGSGMSYVIGHLFYRQDPKVPNRASFETICRAKQKRYRAEHGQDMDAEELVEFCKTEYACPNKARCEFPFPHLHDYLEQRGLRHLTRFVRWKEEIDHRSKVYINLLKVRLRFHEPEKCSVIIRNEAHVRLASSTWYVARALRWAVLSAAVLLGVAMLGYTVSGEAGAIDLDHLKLATFGHLSALVMPLFVLTLAEYGRSRIEQFLHYQRLREVIFVLETAYTAFRHRPELLSPPFELRAGEDHEEGGDG